MQEKNYHFFLMVNRRLFGARLYCWVSPVGLARNDLPFFYLTGGNEMSAASVICNWVVILMVVFSCYQKVAVKRHLSGIKKHEEAIKQHKKAIKKHQSSKSGNKRRRSKSK